MKSAAGRRRTKAVIGAALLLLLLASTFVETAVAVSRKDVRLALQKIRRNPRLQRLNFKKFFQKFVLLAINQKGPITLFLPTDPYTMYTAYSAGYTAQDFATLGKNNMIPEYHVYKDFVHDAAGTTYTTVLGEKARAVTRKDFARAVNKVGTYASILLYSPGYKLEQLLMEARGVQGPVTALLPVRGYFAYTRSHRMGKAKLRRVRRYHFLNGTYSYEDLQGLMRY
ncbi:unnamed protein product, partial [Closterium sp. NIES-54]